MHETGGLGRTPAEVTMTKNENAVAIGLEVGPGLLLQTFGIGHLYAGRVGAGLAIMISYWVLLAINALLTTIWIGFITGPLTLLAFLIFAPTNVIDTSRR
jgi:TM2 domain-containing membrane protein YozV